MPPVQPWNRWKKRFYAFGYLSIVYLNYFEGWMRRHPLRYGGPDHHIRSLNFSFRFFYFISPSFRRPLALWLCPQPEKRASPTALSKLQWVWRYSKKQIGYLKLLIWGSQYGKQSWFEDFGEITPISEEKIWISNRFLEKSLSNRELEILEYEIMKSKEFSVFSSCVLSADFDDRRSIHYNNGPDRVGPDCHPRSQITE